MTANLVDLHFVLSVFHLLILAPLLLFVCFQRAATPLWIYTLLLALGALVLLYHGYRFLVRWMAGSVRTWVHFLHLVTVAPLLLYIGYHGPQTSRPAYELLTILSWGLVGYHMFQLVRLLDAHPSGLVD